MIGRFTSGGYYPGIVAPSFNQHGGSVAPGFELAITAPAGTIYYTLDGSDPREAADPVEVTPPVTILAEAAQKTVYVPTSVSDGFTAGGGNSWNEFAFDDSGWTSGSGGVGYEQGSGYENFFDIDVESTMADQQTTCLIRIPFTIAAGALTDKTGAEIRVRYDDAYVAYLNGTEVARRSFTGIPNGVSTGISHSDGAAIVLESVDISAHISLLNEGGENLLAIHGINTSTGSSDFLISADLRVSEVPAGGGVGGAISPTAIEYTGTVPIISTTTTRARVFDGTSWSALTEAAFTSEFAALVVSEIMYNPFPASSEEIAAGYIDSGDFEFLELLNSGSSSLDLSGVRFTEGLTFDFTGSAMTTIAPGARVVIVKDPVAFEFRYGVGLPVAGQYIGKLKNEGEGVHLIDALDQTIRNFTYDNLAPWPTAPDGQGSSLILIDPDSKPDHSDPASWIAGALGGTPGTGEVVRQNFADWAAANGVVEPNGDSDGDGIVNFLEFFGGTHPNDPSSASRPRIGIDAGGRVTLSIRQALSAGGVNMQFETSTDLDVWIAEGAVEVVNFKHNDDGTVTTTYRTLKDSTIIERGFIRLRISEQ